MVYVFSCDFDQFRHWCRTRGWSVHDRGITGLWRPEHIYGVNFKPGDLVIELEWKGGLYTEAMHEASREFQRRLAIFSEGIGYRLEPTLGFRDKGVGRAVSLR